MLALAIRKAGADQRALQRLALAHADAAVVEERAVALAGGENFVAQRIVDHSVDQIAVIAKTDRHAEVRKTAQVIVRAVERVDDPDLVGLAFLTGFLGEYA